MAKYWRHVPICRTAEAKLARLSCRCQGIRERRSCRVLRPVGQVCVKSTKRTVAESNEDGPMRAPEIDRSGRHVQHRLDQLAERNLTECRAKEAFALLVHILHLGWNSIASGKVSNIGPDGRAYNTP